jgi:hypothetical protein
LAWLYLIDGCENAGNEREKIAHAVTHAEDEYDADTDASQVLLVTERLVCRHHHFEAGIDRSSEENAVSQTQPPLRTDGRYFVTG